MNTHHRRTQEIAQLSNDGDFFYLILKLLFNNKTMKNILIIIEEIVEYLL